MLNIGLGHNRLSYSNKFNPNHIMSDIALKAFEVMYLYLEFSSQLMLYIFLIGFVIQVFSLSTRISNIQNSALGGSVSHQISLLNSLRDQVQKLKEENEGLRGLNFSTEEK